MRALGILSAFHVPDYRGFPRTSAHYFLPLPYVVYRGDVGKAGTARAYFLRRQDRPRPTGWNYESQPRRFPSGCNREGQSRARRHARPASPSFEIRRRPLNAPRLWKFQDGRIKLDAPSSLRWTP
jgi:hypothetical protein